MARPRNPKPLYSVFDSGTLSTICWRAVGQEPADPTDFLSHMQLGSNIDWWQLHRAVGVSAWEDREKAAALATRQRYPLLARLDLSLGDPRLPWARTGSPGHVTLWAPPALFLEYIAGYEQP